jgi:hypothetical protein
MPHDFDIAISFAGEDRPIALELATKLKAGGLLVFYDDDQQAELLGERLLEYPRGPGSGLAVTRSPATKHEHRIHEEG